MEAWSRKHESCTNCGTDEYCHIGRGLCIRCYPLARRLEQLSKWDLSDPQSMKGFPRALRGVFQTQTEVEAFKADARQQIESRLNEFRMREETLSGEISGTDIEFQLKRIARIVVPKGDVLYHGSATLIDHEFNTKQRKLLYGLLSRMEDKRPWAGVHYGKHAANGMVKTFIQKVTKNQTDNF